MQRNYETKTEPVAELGLRDKAAQLVATEWLKSALSGASQQIQTIEINFDALRALIQMGAVKDLGQPRDVRGPSERVETNRRWNPDKYTMVDDGRPSGDWECEYETMPGALLCKTINCTVEAAKLGELKEGHSFTQIYILSAQTKGEAAFLVNHASYDSGYATISTQIMEEPQLCSFLQGKYALLLDQVE